MAAIPLQREVFYPESDGKPMAETDLHIDELIYLRRALRRHFRDEPDVYVAGNLLFYYRQGDPSGVVSPDLFVVKGVPKKQRPKYLLWEEGKVPCMVVEVTSSSTRREDISKKKDLYERLGVEEYFLFDILGDYLNPRLQGYRLRDGRYQPLEPGSDGSLISETVGVILVPEPESLRLVNAATGEILLRPEEVEDRAELEALNRKRMEQEARGRREAEAEVARLREELARLRKE
jgi:Uma2 family endonuclease